MVNTIKIIPIIGIALVLKEAIAALIAYALVPDLNRVVLYQIKPSARPSIPGLD
jgi:hypothetical protein